MNSQEALTKVNDLSESYSEHFLLRAGVNLIPCIGGALDIFVAGRGEKIAKKRIENFIEELKIELKDFNEKKLDKEYLESECFFDLIINTFKKVVINRTKEKTKLFAKIIKNSISNESQKNHDEPFIYLDTISELSEQEMILANKIYIMQKDKPDSNLNELEWATKKGWGNLPTSCPQIMEEDIPFLLKRIEKTGLIKEITGVYLDYNGGIYIITETFRKLMNFINKE